MRNLDKNQVEKIDLNRQKRGANRRMSLHEWRSLNPQSPRKTVKKPERIRREMNIYVFQVNGVVHEERAYTKGEARAIIKKKFFEGKIPVGQQIIGLKPESEGNDIDN